MKIKLVVPIIGLLAAVLLAASSNGQIHDQITGSLRNLSMSFDFAARPSPLQNSIVTYTFEVTEAASKDINILVDILSPAIVRLQSERIITLKGPLQVGDVFQGVIEFVPLVSGLGRVDICTMPRGIGSKALRLAWCLDEDGTLHYLGNPANQPAVHLDPPSHIPILEPFNTALPEGVLHMEREVYNPSKCCVTRSTFFSQDSAVLLGDPIMGRLLQYRVRIEPAFKVGDTSMVTYRLKFKRDIPDGLDMYVDANGFTIVGVPEAVDYALHPDQMVDLVVKVVPMAVGQSHNLLLHIETNNRIAPDSRAIGERILLRAVFNDDGTLRYIHDRDMKVHDPSKLPKTFEPYVRSKHHSRVVIRRDSE